ncbi:MAG: hypothetical protein ILP19_09585 [Oscillospiraceae bacterium]|nr:hypothetical protein [Oscillospiraceae bacterium]
MDDEKDLSRDENEEDRPPKDPKNGLYTVLSLLIFAVCYIGYRFISANISFVYALHEDTPGDQLRAAVCQQMDVTLPEGAELLYIRLHRNFDADRLYLSLALPDDMTEEDFAERFIPYRCGNTVVDERFTVYPQADRKADYIFGDQYVNIDDPLTACLIYEDNGRLIAVFSTDDYDKSISTLFDCEKIRM